MRQLHVRLSRPGMIAALLAACGMIGGGLTRDWGPKPTLAADEPRDGKEDLQERWRRLRSEYVKIAASLGELQEWPERPRVAGLADRQIQTEKAKAASKVATVARQIAEIALTAYTKGTARQEVETAKVELASAEEALKRAEKGLEQVKVVRQQVATKLDAKGDDLTASDILARFNLDRICENDELTLQRCKLSLEMAKTKQALLTFSQKQRELELKSDIEKMRSEELSRQAEWGRAQATEEEARRAEAGPEMRPEERKGLAVLADAVRSPGPKPPWEREPTEFRAFLDKFEAELAVARSLAEQAGEKREMERFLRLTARILRKQAAPGGK